jgi:hypothetical protein
MLLEVLLDGEHESASESRARERRVRSGAAGGAAAGGHFLDQLGVGEDRALYSETALNAHRRAAVLDWEFQPRRVLVEPERVVVESEADALGPFFISFVRLSHCSFYSFLFAYLNFSRLLRRTARLVEVCFQNALQGGRHRSAARLRNALICLHRAALSGAPQPGSAGLKSAPTFQPRSVGAVGVEALPRAREEGRT